METAGRFAPNIVYLKLPFPLLTAILFAGMEGGGVDIAGDGGTGVTGGGTGAA